MDFFILDSTLRRTELVDQYESLIWTERFRDVGDFQLNVLANRGMRNLLTPGTRCAINESKYTMEIETVEDKVNKDGQAELVATGRSLESVMERRANQNIGMIGAVENLIITGTPGDVARELFRRMCRENTNWPEDNLEFLQAGTLLSSGNIPEPPQILTFTFKPDTLYSSIKKICDTYDLGFRIVRDGDKGKLYFEIYSGFDRTPLSGAANPVVFSPELDNLSNTSALTSIELYKNVAYVYGEKDNLVVFEDGATAVPAGFQRRVLVVDASDIDLEIGPDLKAALKQRGLEELAKNKTVVAFDGQISQYSDLEYGVHYGLGDLLQIRSTSGIASNMKVEEQIFVKDKQGKRSYPTLTVNKLITPGSWDAWNGTQVWNDADEYWAEA